MKTFLSIVIPLIVLLILIVAIGYGAIRYFCRPDPDDDAINNEDNGEGGIVNH